MVHMIGGSFWGMHVFWWLFWASVIAAVFALFEPKPRNRRRDSALNILQQRYAAGKISTEEYEVRRKRLEIDGARHSS